MKQESVPLEKAKSTLQKYTKLYKEITKVHQQNKGVITQRKARRRVNMDLSDEETENLPELSLYSSLYRSAELRNHLTPSDIDSVEQSIGVFDTQSQHLSSKSPLASAPLSVITATNDSSSFRFEELCLILLRGVMERLYLQLNPCQDVSRGLDLKVGSESQSVLPVSYTTQARSYSVNQWKEVMQLCRAHSSECTVMIVKLYPQIATLRSELTRLILESPEKYLHCADCVSDFILHMDEASTRWLLYWTQPNLPTVTIAEGDKHRSSRPWHATRRTC